MPKERSAFAAALAALGELAGGAGSRTPSARLPRAGTPLASFDLAATHGPRVSSASLAGSPALIVLWSRTCSASRLALRAVDQIHADYAPRGLRTLVLAEDDEPAALRTFIEEARVSVPVAHAPGLRELFDPGRLPWQKSFPLPSYLIADAASLIAGTTSGVPLVEIQHGDVRLRHVRAMVDGVLAGPSR